MKLFASHVSTLVELLRDSEESETLHSITDCLDDFSKYPLLKIVVSEILNELPFLRRIVQCIVSRRDDIATVENAVENLLTEVGLISVKLSEKFDYDPEIWCNSRETFDALIESKLRVRYDNRYLLIGPSKDGSFEYNVEFNSLLRSCEYLCNKKITFQGFEIPSSFKKLENISDEFLLHELNKLEESILTRYRKEQISVLENLGIGTHAAKQIIRKQLMNNYSIIHQIRNWIVQLGEIKNAQSFAKKAGLQKEILQQMLRFERRFPGKIPIESWFFNYCESRLWFTQNAFPDDIKPDVVFQTTPCEVSDVPPVNGILDLDVYVNENRLFDKLGVDTRKDHLLWFHGTSWDFAKNILRDQIRISRCTSDSDFGKCFYLSDNFTYACDWAKAKYSQPAIVIYHVPCTLYDELNGVEHQSACIGAAESYDRQKVDWIRQRERIGGYETNNLALKSEKAELLFDQHASGVVLLRCV